MTRVWERKEPLLGLLEAVDDYLAGRASIRDLVTMHEAARDVVDRVKVSDSESPRPQDYDLQWWLYRRGLTSAREWLNEGLEHGFVIVECRPQETWAIGKDLKRNPARFAFGKVDDDPQAFARPPIERYNGRVVSAMRTVADDGSELYAVRGKGTDSSFVELFRTARLDLANAVARALDALYPVVPDVFSVQDLFQQMSDNDAMTAAIMHWLFERLGDDGRYIP